jgi:hypothetical protein
MGGDDATSDDAAIRTCNGLAAVDDATKIGNEQAIRPTGKA